jgi:hypothetical protein
MCSLVACWGVPATYAEYLNTEGCSTFMYTLTASTVQLQTCAVHRGMLSSDNALAGSTTTPTMQDRYKGPTTHAVDTMHRCSQGHIA